MGFEISYETYCQMGALQNSDLLRVGETYYYTGVGVMYRKTDRDLSFPPFTEEEIGKALEEAKVKSTKHSLAEIAKALFQNRQVWEVGYESITDFLIGNEEDVVAHFAATNNVAKVSVETSKLTNCLLEFRGFLPRRTFP